ncbi:MAG: hypothetical protein KGI75_27630, partial [Rhizobiaceae bacterium]|nr:hypothetical protein [Rhizobiaceae bacterium]
PEALADYSTKADWPDDWAAREALPDRANFGLLLRWKAALFELEQFLAIAPEKVAAIMSAFASAVTARIANDDAFELLDVRPVDRRCLSAEPAELRWDEIPSVFSFELWHADGNNVLTTTEATAVYKAVAVEQDGSPAIRLGQPVSTGEQHGQPTSALRICLSAPLIVQASRSPQALEDIIAQAITALDRTAAEARRLFAPMTLREVRYK